MMILSKWKGLAMAVVATGLVATGAGVLAQSPHGVPITVDRLGQLENKLDRVLDALGKGGAGQTGTLAAPTPERADPALSRPRAEAAANPFGPDPGARPALARPASESSLERRIESIERRLAALEAQFEHHQARINATLRNGLQLGNELAPAPKSADPVPQAR